jgi:hypothetical protein
MIKRCKLGFATILLIMTVLTFSGLALAVSVDPDAFPVGTNISNAFTNVTLSALGSGFGNITSNIYAVNPSTQPLEPFNASTGSLVFGTDSPDFPHLFRELGFISLRADFAVPVATVSIDFIANDASDIGILRAYNSANTLLASYTTAVLSLNQFETANISSTNIAYIIASGDSGISSIGIDNLNYAPAPTPATLILLSSGLLGLVGFRRFRKS